MMDTVQEPSSRSVGGSRLADVAPLLVAIPVVFGGWQAATLAAGHHWQLAAISAVIALGWALSIPPMRSIRATRLRGESVPTRTTLAQWLPLLAAAEIAAFLSVTTAGVIAFQIVAFAWAGCLARSIRQSRTASTT